MHTHQLALLLWLWRLQGVLTVVVVLVMVEGVQALQHSINQVVTAVTAARFIPHKEGSR
jgi:hypothetical protein